MDTHYTLLKLPITDVDGHDRPNYVAGHNWEMSYSVDDDAALRFIYGCPFWGCNAVDPLRR